MKKALLFGILFFLVACSTSKATTTPNRTVTVPPTLAFTPSPIIALSLSPTLNQTQVAAEQFFTATQSVFQTEVAEFPRLCPNDTPYYSGGKNDVSPDGLWLSTVCYNSPEGLVLTVSNKKTQIMWKMHYQDFIPDVAGADGGMAVIHWANDNRYAYFYSWLGGDGGECFHEGNDSGAGVFRLDLQTGKTKEILPTNNTFFWYGLSFSPTGRRFVYGVHARDLAVLDIQTGDSLKVAHKKDFSEGGGYVWSSDGLQFVYSTVEYLPDNADTVGFTLRLVDAQTGVEQILLESKTSCFLARTWEADNILQVEYSDENYKRAIMEYDVNSNTIISAPSSPSP